MMAEQIKQAASLRYRRASLRDIPELLRLENQCFDTDKLSRRQFRHWVVANNGILLLAQHTVIDMEAGLETPKTLPSLPNILGYGLVIMRKGTSLARLYSLAVAPDCRGMGVAKGLISQLEQASAEQQKLFLRLEVSTENSQAISLYSSLGYKKFGYYADYYKDHNDALRMQKAIVHEASIKRISAYPYYQQTTAFTCGSAALMMAMAKLQHTENNQGADSDDMDLIKPTQSGSLLTQSEELAIWRQATTIFMTSGHGGSHPLGLAVAAIDRGFQAKVFINQPIPLFLAGVRDENKKLILQKVEEDLLVQATQAKATIEYSNFTPDHIRVALAKGQTVLCLISSYQFDGYKGPHWVTVTHIDEHYLYMHDPEPIEILETETRKTEQSLEKTSKAADNSTENYLISSADRQHIPVSLESFDRYTCYGKAKLRTAIVLDKK